MTSYSLLPQGQYENHSLYVLLWSELSVLLCYYSLVQVLFSNNQKFKRSKQQVMQGNITIISLSFIIFFKT
jgi:predicted permease